MRILLFFLCVSALLLPQACGADGELLIATSFYPVYITALNVAGGVPGVKIVNITSEVTGCLHDYMLTTRDMKMLEKADIFIVNGAGMESFLKEIAEHYPNIKIIDISQNIPLLTDDTGRANPHVWVSIPGAEAQTGNLARSLSDIDGKHKEIYLDNAEAYEKKLAALKSLMDEELAPFAGKKIITFHEAFAYFAKDAGLVVAGVIRREPASAPSAKELARVIDLVREQNVKVLFSEPQYPSLAAQTISLETGARMYTLDPAVSGPMGPDAYIDIMRKNIETIKSAFLEK